MLRSILLDQHSIPMQFVVLLLTKVYPSICVAHQAQPLSFATEPLAGVDVTVGVVILSLALLQIIYILAYVAVSIGPRSFSLSIALSSLPYASILSAIGPDTSSGAMTQVVFKLASID